MTTENIAAAYIHNGSPNKGEIVVQMPPADAMFLSGYIAAIARPGSPLEYLGWLLGHAEPYAGPLSDD